MKKIILITLSLGILFLACRKEKKVNPCDADLDINKPGVLTGAINRMGDSLTINGEITRKGNKDGEGITDYGVCWSKTNQDPTKADNKLNFGAHDESPFSVKMDISGFESGDYYFRTFATNCASTSYGVVILYTISVNPCDSTLSNLPKVETKSVNQSGTNLVMKGEITGIGNPAGGGITDYGICWSNSNTVPDVSNHKLSAGSTTTATSFSQSLSTGGLSSGTYYFRAYAKNCAGTEYGLVISYVFGVDPCDGNVSSNLPAITLVGITQSGQNLSIQGNLTSIGNASGGGVTDYGICWSSTNTTPSIADNKLSQGSTTSTGAFSKVLSSLSAGTYYFNAYAINCAGTVYGSPTSYTLNIDPCDGNVPSNLPAITLVGITQSGQNLSIQGNLTNIGNASGGGVTDYGICWSSTNSNPSIADNKLSQGATTSTGAFSKVLSSLSAGTYYFNAYAINCAGTVYGSPTSYTLNIDPCDGNVPSNLPAITLVGITQSGQDLTIQGNLTNIGNASGGGVTDYGICWSSTNSNPSIADNKLSMGATTTTVSFGSALSNLSGIYYFNAYAINCAGTVYGSAQSYTFSSWSCGDLLEYEGQSYTTVQIGSQCWMAENLNVGTKINSNSGSDYQTNNNVIEKYCYDNDEANCDTYGGLYQWDEMMQYTTVESTQGVCPIGWHLPSDDEWKTLEMQLGMSQSEADKKYWRGTNEGSKMAGNAALWNNGNLENDPEFDNSGLAVLPTGFRDINGSFYGQSDYTYLWSSSDISFRTWYRYLNYYGKGVIRNDNDKSAGYSVRCVRY